MEFHSLKKFSKNEKIALLRELGFDSDGDYVLKNGERVFDKYLAQPVKVENMIILPKDTILDCNPVSLTCWLEENNITSDDIIVVDSKTKEKENFHKS